MPTLLLTGFDKWPPHSFNPSWDAVSAASPRLPDGWTVHKALLPVDWIGAPAKLEAEWTGDVGAYLAFGLAKGSPISIERTAHNVNEQIGDVNGKLPPGSRIADDGPDEYETRLPADRINEALKREGIPAEFSPNAGGFLCNFNFYWMLHRIATLGPSIPAGFIHVPFATSDHVTGEHQLQRTVEIAAEVTLAKLLES